MTGPMSILCGREIPSENYSDQPHATIKKINA
jgi:hypothetical protein